MKVSCAFVYGMFCHAHAQAVPPAMSNLSTALVAQPLKETIYLPSKIAFSSAQFASQVFPIQFAHPPATIALALAVVGAIVDQVFVDLTYLYIVTALFPSKYALSSLASIANTDVASGCIVQAVDVVSCVAVFDAMFLICPIPVPAVILT